MLINSQRTFGVELELGFPDDDDLRRCNSQLPPEWNMVRDGSLTCKNPVELVSPILKGDAGLEKLKKACGLVEKYKGFGNHPSCGLHVHLGCKEFKPKKNTLYFNEAEYKAFIRSSKHHVTSTTFLTYSGVRGYTGKKPEQKLTESDYERAYIYARQFNTNDRPYFASRPSGKDWLILCNYDGLKTFYSTDRAESEALVKEYKELTKQFESTERWKEIDDKWNEYEMKVKAKGAKLKGKYVVEFESAGNFEGLKRTFYFYTVFNDVMQNMVQNSRKMGNMYCQSLNESFDHKEILKLKSLDELQMLWYKVDSPEAVRLATRTHYQDSRYHDINLHSLWYQHGTIEIRSHAGTIDWRKIALWVVFHQQIIDRCSAGDISLDDIQAATDITDLREKVLYMLTLLRLPESVEKYVKRVVNYFALLKQPL